ncbi:hypothetical protein O6H91_11G016100 [Diphasiastrum complanatum]|uniref:Uncharacterized protein n=3 Tax=Diphasiastrum complanatum TaxID=34168 RepID=A0ACC2C6Q6_DIPCM|nr:hypothetical protein O6H91_11G014900 [Diphasiastrum complanatum]KAJ7537658.1 hypothetical protein O6H91_11G016100 [Diphasiastrum complanatum]KAJ7537660.1 hypothetical protein O6H91_11G016100 [Diphasiastrum complanatum]
MMKPHPFPESPNHLQIELEPVSTCQEVSGKKDSYATTLAICSTATSEGASRDSSSLYGITSVCGRRREMEDAVIAISAFMHLPCNVVGGCNGHCMQVPESERVLDFYGVYDGHGGSQASLLCKNRLHLALAEEVKALNIAGTATVLSEWKLHWQNIMSTCFLKVDAEVGGGCYNGSKCMKCQEYGACLGMAAPETAGSTAVVAIIGRCQIIVGNCGDSRAVLSRGGKAISVSNDHKPDREDEMARIEAAGGRVIFWNGYRVLGVLAMSRAIGDRYLKPYVIAEPEVTCLQRTDEDEFLILASDGLWDVISNDTACDLVRRRLGDCDTDSNSKGFSLRKSFETDESPYAAAAAFLTKVALARGSHDNITVVVIDLKVKR